jgi:hypothetical protein
MAGNDNSDENERGCTDIVQPEAETDESNAAIELY